MNKNSARKTIKKIISYLLILFILVSVFSVSYIIRKPDRHLTGFGAIPGDCEGGDGDVDILDFQALSNTFAKSPGDTGYNAACNFNTDPLIEILDYQVLSNNFGNSNTGSVTPTPPSVTPGGNLTKITFTASTEDIRNPERGFYSQSNIFADQPYNPGKLSTKEATDSLVWVYFHLDNYRDPRDGPGINLTNYQGKPLEPVGSGKGLDTVSKTFQDARNKGLKLVIRFLYVGYSGIGSNSNPATSQPDAPLSLVQLHLNQLAPLFAQNKDVIAAFQFGMVGYWGEWHSSKYLYSQDARRSVMNAVLAATPRDRTVQVRYPRYKQVFFGGPLNESNAFNQSDLARIGFHDDAFLKDDNDDGTFKSTTMGTKITNYCDGYAGGEISCWRDYVAKDSRFVSVSGEAGTHSSTPSQYALCPNALNQLTNMHFNSIHNGYSMVTLNAWTNGGCMPEIRRRLGYRFELKEVNLTKTVSPGQTLSLNGIIKNSGFGPLFNQRPFYLVLTGPQRYQFLLSGVDPRQWSPGTEKTFDVRLALPSDITRGTYNLSFWLPDQEVNLRNNPKYSVRFANNNVWEATGGINIITNDFSIR